MIQRLQKKQNEEGFTLIELLIVIIVLGILAAIVVFAIGTTRSDAVESSCRTNFKAIELSSEAVATKTGGYGAAQADITSPANGALLKTWPSGGTDYTFTYAAGVITIPSTGKVVGGTTAAGCVKKP